MQAALDVAGARARRCFFYAYLNASFETGFTNPIDEAIRTHRQFDLAGYRKLDEVPYDFLRKRLSVLVAQGETHLLVTKGALQDVLEVCTTAETATGNPRRPRRGAGPRSSGISRSSAPGLPHAGRRLPGPGARVADRQRPTKPA